jgi:peptidoglycan/LPS O-acetylase OafA/YrhL
MEQMHLGRVFGLDLMRAIAIVLVVFDHNIDALGRFVPGMPKGAGIDGVDLFFVLSGYLIGGILLKYAAMDGVPLWKRALDFWQRRWLRTLPNYYLFLLLNMLMVYCGIGYGLLNHNTWGYFFFLQNVWKPVDLFFWESWSLVVEEWYYLLFPIGFFGMLAVTRSKVNYVFLFVTLLLIVTATAIRSTMAEGIGSVFELEEGVRKLVITRMDTLGWGMLAAWCAQQFPMVWKRSRIPLLVFGIVAVCVNASIYGNAHLRYSCTLYFTVGAAAMAALLPALSAWRTVPAWGRPIVFISIVSYALYLVHQPLRVLYVWVYWDRSPTAGVIAWVLYWAICFLLAWLVYRFWERRFMDMREGLGRRLGVRS